MSSETNSEHRVLRILAVEDDNHIGRIIQMAMSSLDVPHEFTLVFNAEEGLELWNEQPFDLLLADYNLRGMNGLKLVTTLREQGFEHVPMVLITAYDNPKLAREANEAGITAYIPKPFFIEDLINTIRNLLPKKSRSVNSRS
ncbi:MAG: response regulator [Chloroflexaceae bacterium]